MIVYSIKVNQNRMPYLSYLLENVSCWTSTGTPFGTIILLKIQCWLILVHFDLIFILLQIHGYIKEN